MACTPPPRSQLRGGGRRGVGSEILGKYLIGGGGGGGGRLNCWGKVILLGSRNLKEKFKIA